MSRPSVLKPLNSIPGLNTTQARAWHVHWAICSPNKDPDNTLLSSRQYTEKSSWHVSFFGAGIFPQGCSLQWWKMASRISLYIYYSYMRWPRDGGQPKPLVIKGEVLNLMYTEATHNTISKPTPVRWWRKLSKWDLPVFYFVIVIFKSVLSWNRPVWNQTGSF